MIPGQDQEQKHKNHKKGRKKKERRVFTPVEEILRQTARINAQINSKLEEISYWRELATKTQTVFSIIKPGGGPNRNKSRVEECVCRISDIEKSLTQDMNDLIALKEKAMNIIDKIDVPEYKSLLIHRYVCGKTWCEVADLMGYSYVHTVNRLHPKALEKIKETGAEE